MKRTIVFIINSILGISLWFGYFTNVSLVGKYSDILYPIVVGIVGFLSYRYLSGESQKPLQKLLNRASVFGSIIGAGCNVILLIPPMLLFSISVFNSRVGEYQIQQLETSNGHEVNIYQRLVGFVDADERISVRQKLKMFPIIEIEIYDDFYTPYCANTESDCFQWASESSIVDINTGEILDIQRGINFSMPLFLSETLIVIGVLIQVFV